METKEPTAPENAKAIEILTAALEEARQGRITGLALLTFDTEGGVHTRSCVQHSPMEPAAVKQIVREIEGAARGLTGEVRRMEVKR